MARPRGEKVALLNRQNISKLGRHQGKMASPVAMEEDLEEASGQDGKPVVEKVGVAERQGGTHFRVRGGQHGTVLGKGGREQARATLGQYRVLGCHLSTSRHVLRKGQLL